jgi:hypothetical protein
LELQALHRDLPLVGCPLPGIQCRTFSSFFWDRRNSRRVVGRPLRWAPDRQSANWRLFCVSLCFTSPNSARTRLRASWPARHVFFCYFFAREIWNEDAYIKWILFWPSWRLGRGQ